MFSGTSAPVTDITLASIKGQMWLDTTVAALSIVKQYDGVQWITVGAMDVTNHIWTPPIAGGVATNVTSATTTDLWSVRQSVVTVTGTVTITALANSSAVVDTLKFVKFAGVLTLTHNATSLILPGAANIVTAAGDYAVVRALTSTNVAVVAYFRAAGRTLNSGVTDTLAVGYSATSFSAGTKSSGTFTPDPASGNMQHVTNNGAHTLAPPSSTTTMILEYTNGASAGTITTSGFTKADTAEYNTTNANKFHFYITKTNTHSYLRVVGLQ